MMNNLSRLLQSCRLLPVVFLLLTIPSVTQGKAYFHGEAGCHEGRAAIHATNAEFPVLLTGEDCCKGSKPVSLTLLYTGEGCGATDTSQKPGKYSCSDSGAGPNGAATVYIVASEKSNGGGTIYFTDNVALGSSFTVTSANKFKSNTWFSIFASQNGALLQRVQIHTSCSAPLVLGEQFGSLILENVVFENGTSCQPVPPPPPPSDVCPQPVIEVLTDELCAGEAIVFKTPDLGIPCLVYSWNFGQGASPQTATGTGPHSVTFSTTGQPTVSLNINNDCAGGTGTVLCPPTIPTPPGDVNCFKIDPPKSGTSNGVTYTVTNQGGEPKFLTVTGAGIVSVNVKGGPVSVTYTNPPYTNLTAPINPNNGTPYGISHFTICVESGSGGGGGGGGTDCCTSGNKPKGLTLKYTGQSCAATNTTQAPGKYSCNDSGAGPNGAASVFIKATDNSNGTGTNYFSGTVALDANFSINAPSGKLKSNSWLLIYTQEGGALLQRVQIHTSCSAPIVPGEQFGSLKLLGVQFENGETCGENGGGTGTNPGTDCCDSGKNKPKGLTLLYTGEGCGATNTTQAPGKYSCNDTGAGPNGAATVFIKATDKSNGTGTNYFSGTVALGANFSINAPSGKLKSNSWLLIYTQEGGTLLQTVQIHTSCSAPLVPGEQFGSLKLLAVQYENGDICGDNSGGTPDCLDCDKTTTVTIDIEDCNPLGEIGDYVWLDSNGNGLQDDGEPGIPGVPVLLMNCAGAVLKAEFTDGNGKYLFDNLPAGFYKVTFTNPKPGELTPTLLNEGNDDTIDSDADLNGNTGCIELGPGESNLTIDAGFSPVAPPCSINPSATNITCTDNGTPDPADDLFTFVLTVNGSNTGTGWNALINNVNVSGAYGSPILLGPFPISGGTIIFDIVDNGTATCKTNLAVVPPATCSQPLLGKIGDQVWFDLNGNGLQDGNEPGIPGVTVDLENCAGGLLTTTVTDSEGKYCFDNLQAGQYRVNFQNPGSFNGNQIEFTNQNVGNNPNIDSDADANGLTACITLGQGETNLTIDAGLKPTPCDNVTYAGKIGYNQSECGPYDPAEIVSLALPIGGTGQIEYRWLQSTTGCPNSFTQAIANSNSPNFDPGTFSETTWYVRQARRAGCTQWVESNCIKKEVLDCGGTNNCGVSISVAPGTITVERQGGPAAGIQVFNADYSATIFSCAGNCNNPQVITGLTPGTYNVRVNATWTPFCQVDETVIVPSQLGSGGSSNLSTPTGNGNLPVGSFENLAELEVYPNPAKGTAFVRWNTQADWQQATLTVFNQLGQQVQVINIEDMATGNYRLDLNGMNDGQYFIHFRAEGQMPIVKKLTVKR